MKNIKKRVLKKLLIIAITLSATTMFGCSQNTEIENTSKKFLEGFYSMDFKSIYKISSPNTLEKIQDIESRIDGSFDKSQIAVPIVVIHEYTEEGDTAICRYTLKTEKDDPSAMSEQLILIKKDGKWIVEY